MANRLTNRFFVGIKSDLKREVFRSAGIPNENTFGEYSAVIGPFRTKRAAVFMANCQNNPHCLSVSDAERISKEFSKCLAR